MANMYKTNKKSSGSSANLQTKTITAGTSAQTVQPDSGYDGFSEVTVNPTPSQTKSVTATTSAQTVSPDSGKLLSSVTVNPQSHSGSVSYSSNGQKDLGANHNTRYVNISVPTSSGLSETTLWTNSSPSSDFSGQSVSVAMSSYDYIKIYFHGSKSDTTEYVIMLPKSYFSNTSDSKRAGISTYTSSTFRGRTFYYASSSSIYFANGFSGGSAAANYFIPTKISGLR